MAGKVTPPCHFVRTQDKFSKAKQAAQGRDVVRASGVLDRLDHVGVRIDLSVAHDVSKVLELRLKELAFARVELETGAMQAM